MRRFPGNFERRDPRRGERGRTSVQTDAFAGTAAAAVTLVVFAVLAVMERRRPLRPRREPEAERLVRNLVIGLGGAAAVALVERPLADRLARRVRARGLGLTAPLPEPLRTVAGLLAMDYTLYVWHVLTHRVPWLWRFHRAHHADRDLTLTTALRFHAVEMLLSVPWRLAQVRLFGVAPRTLDLWRRLTFLSVAFHHADVALPERWERRLSRWIATPGLHGIHHSVRREEQDSNWSSGLALWDRLHGTWRTRAKDPLVIGFDESERRPRRAETQISEAAQPL